MATVPLGRYLWERIYQIGVRTVMGLPGDFNLWFLDHLFEVPGLKWVGNANELNAAYAADGYAKVRGLPGVFVTTIGVGELSALNGVAGAYAEQVKMIHIVGQTTRRMQAEKMLIHHALGLEPDHQAYNKMSKLARVAAAELNDIKTAPMEIDRVIRECIIRSHPVYIFFPLDLALEEVPASLLDAGIDLSLPVDQKAQDTAFEAIQTTLQEAKRPCIFVDALVHRHNAVREARELVDRLMIPTYSANISKGLIDETHPCYVGVFNGLISSPGLSNAFHNSDLVLVLGSLPADTNSGGFTRNIKSEKSIEINPNDVVVKGKKYPHTFIKPLLEQLVSSLSIPSTWSHLIPKLPVRSKPKDHGVSHITQSWIWHRIAEFLRPGDVVVSETGTSNFGILDTHFPEDICFVSQIYYGSIGYATAAALGTELALLEIHSQNNVSHPRGRTILLTGDGSLGLTMQEIGTMVTQGTAPVIFIINNDGYTVERVIHGARQPYNDINPTNYAYLLPLFNHPDPGNSFRRCRTKEELLGVLSDPTFQDPKDAKIVEVIMDKKDVPWRLSAQLAIRGPQNKKYLKEEGFVVVEGEDVHGMEEEGESWGR